MHPPATHAPPMHAPVMHASHATHAPPPWREFLTHASEYITLPQTSIAGGENNDSSFPHIV